MLRILKEVPSDLLDRKADRLADALGGPALIRIEGERAQPLFVSVLLHGNETTGWEALRMLLRSYRGGRLPRNLDLFVGNVHAARRHQRRLPGQPDFNRIWADPRGPEEAMVKRLLCEVRGRRPLLALDIHNTSGRNPSYAVCHRRSPEHLGLARLFSDTVVFVDRPQTMLGVALCELAPTITMECGRPGIETTEREVCRFVDSLLCNGPPSAGCHSGTVLLRPVATVRVPEEFTFSFAREDVDLRLMPELDRFNFCTMPAGTPIARVATGVGVRLEALDGRDEDVGDRFFRVDGEFLVTRVPLTPSLLTLDERIIRQDCLCYLMEPLPRDEGALAAAG